MLKKRILPSLFSLIGFAAAALAAYLLTAHLGNLAAAVPEMLSLSGDTADTLRGIGTQLSASTVTPHILIPAVIGIVFTALRFACPPAGGGTLTLYILAGILLWLAALAGALLFTRLGGIRMLDIVRTAADLIGGGILENL